MRSYSRSPVRNNDRYDSKHRSSNRSISRSKSPRNRNDRRKSYSRSPEARRKSRSPARNSNHHNRRASRSPPQQQRSVTSRRRSPAPSYHRDYQQNRGKYEEHQNERVKNQDRKRDASVQNDVERWPNDMFLTPQQPSTSRGFNQQNRGGPKKNMEDQFMDTRRLQREAIGEEGVEFVWAKSPARQDE